MLRSVPRLLAICFLCFVLAACGEDETSGDNADAGVELDGANATTNSGNATTNSDNATTNNSNTSMDAGIDGGGEDAGPTDAGEGDAGDGDAGTGDAGAGDAGMDAAMGDAGTDMAPDMEMATYDTCDGAIDVTAGGTFTGTTVGANSDYGPRIGNNCPAGLTGSFADVVYSVTPTANTTYDFVVTPTGAMSRWDPVIYIQTDCSTSRCEDGSTLNGEGDPESITGFSAMANTTYFIIIDSETFRDGDFSFEVTVNP